MSRLIFMLSATLILFTGCAEVEHGANQFFSSMWITDSHTQKTSHIAEEKIRFGKNTVHSKNTDNTVRASLKNEPMPVFENTPAQYSNVDVVWVKPVTPVDGYQIYYGYSPEQLEFQEKVYVDELKEVTDPAHGTVYRYTLESMPEGTDIYVSLAAFVGEDQSEKSEVFRVRNVPTTTNNYSSTTLNR